MGLAGSACGYLLVNVCLEFGYFWGKPQGTVYSVFFGIPYGDSFLPEFMRPFRSGYLEPFYRLNFLDIGKRTLVHEVGLLLKITTWKI